MEMIGDTLKSEGFNQLREEEAGIVESSIEAAGTRYPGQVHGRNAGSVEGGVFAQRAHLVPSTPDETVPSASFPLQVP
jgi:hypothetical protein